MRNTFPKKEKKKSIGLRKADRFVMLEKQYGGRQQWLQDYDLKSAFLAKRACGVTAAANALWYAWDRTEGESIDSFARFQAELMEFLPVRIYGIPLVSIWKRGVRKYVEHIGQKVRFYEPEKRDLESVKQFLFEQLSTNRPVCMIHWNTKINSLRMHWVTITAMEEEGDATWITTSNWGKKMRYSLEEIFASWSLYRRFVALDVRVECDLL